MDRPLEIPYRPYFAWHSAQWHGSPCFLDTVQTPAIPALARAFLITWDQFEDVVAQENGREPTPAIVLGREFDALEEGYREALGPGRYDNLLCVGRIDGRPVLTFTSPWTLADAEAHVGAPSRAYVTVMINGLRESRTIADDALVSYLGAAPGCSEELVSSVLAAT